MLLQPRRRVAQPQGPVAVDWANPLTRGLVSALIPDGAGYVDYLRRESYPSTSGLIGHSRLGRIVSLDGAGYTNLGATSIGGVNLFASAVSGSWTVVTCAKASAAGSTGTFLAKAGSSDTTKTLQIFRSGTSTQTPAVIVRGSTNATNWGLSDTEFHQFAVSFEAGTAVATAYGDDDKRLTLSIGGAAEQSENIVIGARTGGTGARLTGETSYTYFFSRALSQQEVASLYRNPWQIFRPLPARYTEAVVSGPVQFYRPAGDLIATGWTSTAATLAGAINEPTPADASYITSPDASSATPARLSLPSMPAGSYTLRLRARRAASAGELRVVLLDAANAPVGASAWQALTGTYATYSLAVATTGTATRFEIEVRP